MWITVLLGLLSLLLQWWMKRKQSNRAPREQDIRNTNKIIGLVEQIKAIAVPMGCSPEGEPPDQLREVVGASVIPAEGFLSDKLYEFAVEQYVIPILRNELSPELQAAVDQYHDQLKAFIVTKIKESQQ